MDDPWADTPSSTIIPPRPPKADRRSIPQPTLMEGQVEEVKADETITTTDEVTGFTDEVEEDESNDDVHGAIEPEEEQKADGFDDFGLGQNGITAEPEGDGGFDDFDDFDAPAAGPSVPGEDGFGDFGDFEEGDFDEPNNQVQVQEKEKDMVPEVPSRQWVSQRETWM
jgi:hypothetical protein